MQSERMLCKDLGHLYSLRALSLDVRYTSNKFMSSLLAGPKVQQSIPGSSHSNLVELSNL